MRALTLAVFVLAATSSVTAKRAIDGQRTSYLGTTSDPLKAVHNFQKMAHEAFGDLGFQAGQLAYNLEHGAHNAVALSSSTCDACEASSKKMTLTVTHSKKMQGELATPSHTPLMWTLSETTTYTLFSDEDFKVKLMTTGVGLSGYPEGLKLYQESKCEEACKDKGDLKSIALCERDKLFEFFKEKWKSMKTDAYLKDPSNKIARVLKPMYGSAMKYAAIRAKGSHAWPKIIYGMTTIPTTEIEFFLFSKEGSSNVVSMRQHEVSGSFIKKNGADFSPKEFKLEYAMGESFAPSGLNFAAMVAAGRTDLNGEHVTGGLAKKIVKLASPCKGDKKDKYDDKTTSCKSAEGRVAWRVAI